MKSIKLTSDTYALTFTYGNDHDKAIGGNGWCVIKAGELKECWLQQREKKSYKDLITKKKISFDMENVIIRDLKACGSNYMISFDGMQNNVKRNKAVLLRKKLN